MARFKKILLAGAGATAMLAVGTAAGAAITGASGTFTERQTFARNDAPINVTSAGFVDVASVVVGIPSGTRRMLDARFTAETLCSGSGGWCSARIVATNASTGSTVELAPVSGTDYAFDSPGDNWEGHALERSSHYLPAGTYRVRAQAAIVAGATSLRLDDTHLAVEVIRP
ncbi:hypothetical protein GCM10010124_30370 [Pilimelia terevasa]|uniref:Uncharacterized protein n=1 Tax=Pilimelia terevasa TaxID=53372 RepID=A0A8J3FJZ8_9ACTN|nr:hypothetical protein [Pilimelia terevasa]GGK35585.1 hypothetical protein GCM10010124_30370 [Pilimelia terevasa]